MRITNPDTLTTLLVGSSHYFDLDPGNAVVYYETATRAHMVLPGGAIKHGNWALTATGYHVDWEGGPSADWQLDYEPGKFTYFNDKGEQMATLTKIVPGDPEGLASAA